jgi:hypothetical protein
MIKYVSIVKRICSFSDVKIWEILVELVRVNTHPHPSNPFAIDWDYLETVSLQERILLSAALINFLQRIIQHQPGDRSYSARGKEEWNNVREPASVMMEKLGLMPVQSLFSFHTGQVEVNMYCSCEGSQFLAMPQGLNPDDCSVDLYGHLYPRANRASSTPICYQYSIS